VTDRPGEAIVPHLTLLLQDLVRSADGDHWAQYLDGDEPCWTSVVLAGQSQGGSMAAFIAQTRNVAGVVTFSGGWTVGPVATSPTGTHAPA
jgi:esterase/lipase